MKLNLEIVKQFINQNKHFEGELFDGSIYMKINEYVPYVCFSIHNGHRLRHDLAENCLLSEYERWYEEDPYTYDFIESLPIVISANDSRYEYDLNRSAENCVYKDHAWGKAVWKTPLLDNAINTSKNKHQNFYKLANIVIKALKDKFSSVVVFDIHSYNYKRLQNSSPLFNIGTKNIDRNKFGSIIDFWKKELNKIELPSIQNEVKENDVFYGRGYLLEYFTKKYDNVLVLATEIKKVYCDENTQEPYPILIEKLANQIKNAIVNTVNIFSNVYTTLHVTKKNNLLSSELDMELKKIDKQLFQIVKDFEILYFINPINIEQAKKEFFKSKFTKSPTFLYPQLSIDQYAFKRKLYALQLHNITDISLRMMYQEVIDSYADKLDILASIGTDKMLYNSLRYFGEPTKEDLKNAEYLLHCSNSIDAKEPLNLTDRDVYNYFIQKINQYGFNCKVEISKRTISKVLVLNHKKTIRIRKNSLFSKTALNALAEHEVGVHMVTTINSRLQPLSIFRLGTPINTHTQEGLAILNEYLSGNLTIERLHFLALRVLAINNLIAENNFVKTYHYVKDISQLDDNQAFYLTARVYRGGGFTKDYLYLKGFKDIYNIYKKNINITNLLIGKTSLKYLSLINEMIDRKVFYKPTYISYALKTPKESNPTINYVLSGMK